MKIQSNRYNSLLAQSLLGSHVGVSLIMLLGLIVPFVNSPAQDTFEWTAGDGSFEDPINWSGEAVPGAMDSASFVPPGEIVVTLPVPREVARVNLRGKAEDSPTVIFDMNGHKLTIGDLENKPHKHLHMNVAGTVLVVRNGTLAIPQGAGIFGAASDIPPQIRVEADGILETGPLGSSVGRVGSALATVQDGGKWLSTGGVSVGGEQESTGELIIQGSGSHWQVLGETSRDIAIVGGSGKGNTRIIEGATAEMKLIHMGSGSGGEGTLEVLGEGSLLECGKMILGTEKSSTDPTAGIGRVTIANGGSVKAGHIQVFPQSSVSLDNSSLTITGFFREDSYGASVFDAGSILEVALNGNSKDPKIMAESLLIEGCELKLRVDDSARLQRGDTIPLIQTTAKLDGSFANIDEGSELEFSGYKGTIHYETINPGQVDLKITSTP